MWTNEGGLGWVVVTVIRVLFFAGESEGEEWWDYGIAK